MIFKPVLFTFVPSLGGAERSLERLWGVFGSPLVPIGKFWVEKDGSDELPGAPTSSQELPGAPTSSAESVSVGGAAAAREYEGDPQLHAV